MPQVDGMLKTPEDRPIFTPTDAVRYLARARKARFSELKIPELLLLTYQSRDFEYAKQLAKAEPVEWWSYQGRLAKGKFSGREIAISHTYVGARVQS